MPEFKKIAVAGAGGIGSHLVSLLFDYGFNRKQFKYSKMEIDVYDDDTIDQSNLLHQNFKMADLGKYKVDILEKKYAINPIKRFMGEEDFKNYELIFSCVDNMIFRKSLYNWFWDHPKNKLQWIDGRCTSTNGILLTSDMSKARLEKFIDDSQESAGCLLQYEKENNISHVLPVVVAGAMTQLFLNKIRGSLPMKQETLLMF